MFEGWLHNYVVVGTGTEVILGVGSKFKKYQIISHGRKRGIKEYNTINKDIG